MSHNTQKQAQAAAKKQYGKNWENHASISENAEGKWEIIQKANLVPAEEVLAAQAANTTGENLVEVSVAEQQTAPDATQVLADEVGASDPTDEEIAESNTTPAPGSMASMIGNMLGSVPVPEVPQNGQTQEPQKQGNKIEQNREERNGLKRPSKGSTCEIIWRTCDQITETKGSSCTSGELFQALPGYNDCTLRTQYARWRQFNGITGRLPGQTKQTGPKVPEQFAEVLDSLNARISEDKKEVRDALLACKDANELVVWMSSNFIHF